MADVKFQNRYRIPSARAQWHDYNGGAYFITICTAHRRHYFGFIKNNQMHYSEIGQYAFDNLQNIQTHYPYAEIPLFQVMPNHLHAVVFIDVHTRRTTSLPNDDANSAHTRRAASLPNDDAQSAHMWRAASLQSNNEKMQEIANNRGLLSVCMGGLKSAVTKYANINIIDFAWQTRFHDHIIRDTNEMNRIADYIENNVANWKSDCFYD